MNDQPTVGRFAFASTSGPSAENGISRRIEQPPSGCGVTAPSSGTPPDPNAEKRPFSRSPHGAEGPVKTTSIPIFVSAIGPIRISRTAGTGAAAGGVASRGLSATKRKAVRRLIARSL